jgi:hypothetical protein
MANETVGVNVNIKTNVAGSIGELKALKKQLKETAAGSEDFKRLTNEIDDLEDKLKGSKQAAGDWIDQLASAPGPLGQVGGALNKLKVSTQTFGGALKATGIGLFVAALGGLIAAFAQSERATKKLQPLLIGFQKIFNGIFAAIEPVFDAFIDLATQALPYVTKGFGVAYSAITAFLQGIGSLGKAVGKLIQGDFVGAWDSAKEAVTGFGKRYDEANKRFIAGTQEVTKTEQEELDKRKEAQEKAAEEKRKREEAELQYEQQLEDLRRKRFEENVKYSKFLREQDLKARDDERKKEEENEKKFLENRDKTIQAGIERNLKVIQGLQDLTKERNKTLTELLLSQDEIEMARLDEEYRKKYELIKGNKEAEVALEIQYEGIKKNLRMNALNEELGNYASAAGNISQLLGQTTAAGKAFAIAEATINTYKAASQVFAAPVPGVAPVSLGVKIATMISALATGFKNVRAIIATKPSGTVGNPPSITPNNTQAPIAPTPTPQVTSTLLNAQAIQQLGSATNRAYVLESDVTNSQERIRRINRAARLG